MAEARYLHTATLLSSGKVLVAGGYGSSSYLASAELYDPVTNSWLSAGTLTTARVAHTATLLSNGKVLVAGGRVGSFSYVASAELYDPTTNSWSSAGSLATARTGHTAILLPNLKVLVAGGDNSYPCGAGYVCGGFLSSAELYDPATNSWSSAGELATAREYHTVTMLTNGKVLVAGGASGSGGSYPDYYTVGSAELYDPTTNTWSSVASLATARTGQSATLLPNGKVLIAGGGDSYPPSSFAGAELYDPATNTWSPAGSLTTARVDHTARLLSNGKVLVAGGGADGSFGYVASAELYDPSTNSWSPAGSLATARRSHTATRLPGGWVLVTGGYGSSGSLASAELFDPTPNFLDIAGNWASPYIDAIAWAGITTGCGGNLYCPTQNVTRQQMAAFVVRAKEGEPPVGYCGTTAPFTDTPYSSSMCGYVKRLAELAVTTGCGGGNFCPNGLVSRDQMAVLIVRTLEGDPAVGYCGATAPFSDVLVSHWACGHIKRLAELGVTTGCGSGNYCPSQNVTREQMAAFLARAFLRMQ